MLCLSANPCKHELRFPSVLLKRLASMWIDSSGAGAQSAVRLTEYPQLQGSCGHCAPFSKSTTWGKKQVLDSSN